MKEPTRVLFVCLGNICRSPLAEGLFRHHVTRAGLANRFDIDSAGTGGWHAGEPPDPRMRRTARERGVDLSQQRARALVAEDLTRFDHLLAMDRQNLRHITGMGPARARVALLRDFDPSPGDGEVPDPYYGGDAGFTEVYEIVERATQALLERLRASAR